MSKSGDRSVMMMHSGGNPVFCSTLAAGKAISPIIKVVVSHRAVSGLRSWGTAGALGTGAWVLQDTVAGWEVERTSRAASVARQIGWDSS